MYEELRKLIEKSNKIAFFGGAGVSTESNIPDFRSEDGLYNAKKEYGRSPEEMVSHSFFVNHTETFFDYYKKNMVYPDAKPNKAHYALAKLEQAGKMTGIVTQNVDGLHQLAGSEVVFELHGSAHRNYCLNCGKTYDLAYILDEENCKGTMTPYCAACGGIVRPDVVLYEESLDDAVVMGAVQAIKNSDLLIIGGTSLAVYPAAGLINYFNGKNGLVLVNKSSTSYDYQADIVIHEKIGEVLSSVTDNI